MTNAETVRRFWETCEARDWEAFAALLSPDVEYEIPQSRERVRGREAFTRFNAEFPGDWHLRLERLVADDDGAASWIDFWIKDEHVVGIAFFTFAADGLVATVSDFWPDPYEPPAGRAHLVERY